MEKKDDIRELECRLLVEAIYCRWGYDFRQYRISSLMHRIEKHAEAYNYASIAELIPEILYNHMKFKRLLFDISISVTCMFRDPVSIRALSEKVFPTLNTYPYLNVWHAGCATGEEAYSMAIMLEEAGLLPRTQIYATDINDRSLETCKKGIYPITELRDGQKYYHEAGGQHSLTEYYHCRYGSAKMNQRLKNNIVFSNHNLVTDGIFAEMQLIVCKNVLIYFDQHLQHRVLKLFTDSLCRNGFLCLGKHESLLLSPILDQFELIDSEQKIYKKIAY
ncbi:protein-glutamate O-methyltransferase CheR [Salinimonas sp. HHU 13199]|uniref:Protein-glutamate O-methyltransferase CheR n=1 Tax=Salinimonas profundi TaxID=2729140 RepID=A0ABR8LS48_9ALTE|nr:protein-glutamate O-methyltransferase CheR [Salinimonas profundi]MBD3586764.1 protein-glutamate O-methyltransferase CheR [Salinimonas profundi]